MYSLHITYLHVVWSEIRILLGPASQVCILNAESIY